MAEDCSAVVAHEHAMEASRAKMNNKLQCIEHKLIDSLAVDEKSRHIEDKLAAILEHMQWGRLSRLGIKRRTLQTMCFTDTPFRNARIIANRCTLLLFVFIPFTK